MLGILLTRKQAIMQLAIPQQMRLMVSNGWPPTWEMFSRSSGWKETIENLQLTKEDQDDYQTMWGHMLEDFARKGATS